MPRPPFVLSRETERAAIDRVIREPAKRQLLYEMVDAVLRVRVSGTVSSAELAPILASFEATDEAVWSRASGWLAKLHGFAPELSRVLDELSRHRSAVVRLHLCGSLNSFPVEVVLPLFRRFMQDRSRKVRDAVLGVAVAYDYRLLVPDFETLLTQERDAVRQQDIRQTIALLRGETFIRDGMQIRKLPDGSIESVLVDDVD